MRDPLIRKADAWADFLNGLFLRKVWREPLAAEKPVSTSAPELPLAGSSALSLWSQSHTKLSDLLHFDLPAELNKNAKPLATVQAFGRLQGQQPQSGSPVIRDLTRIVGAWSGSQQYYWSDMMGPPPPPCMECGTPSKSRYCLICNDRTRDRKTIMVVDTEEAIRDANSQGFNGVFHWLRVHDSQDGLVQRLQENKDSTAILALRNDPERTDTLISWFKTIKIDYSVRDPGTTMPNGTPTVPRMTDSDS